MPGFIPAFIAVWKWRPSPWLIPVFALVYEGHAWSECTVCLKREVNI